MKKKTVLSLLVVLCLFLVTGCNKKSNNIISNTTWKASDSSQVIFTDKDISWYQSADNHDDNYYAGTYKFYRGEDAVKHITTELSEYNVTNAELERLFNSSKEGYEKANFVVFDITYSKFIVNGESKSILKPRRPWYGFILKDDTYLDVANMNTGTYYKFTKQADN